MSKQKTTLDPREVLGYIDKPIAENIPAQLKIRPQWVTWSYKLRNGKWTKIPYDPNTGRQASTTDLLTWSCFETVLAALEDGRFDGIGFVFCSADPFVGLDFDGCRNPETGEVSPEVLAYVKRFENEYTEISVSGTGVHIITCGKLAGGTKRGNIEIYGQDRFFALTGVMLDA